MEFTNIKFKFYETYVHLWSIPYFILTTVRKFGKFLFYSKLSLNDNVSKGFGEKIITE